MRVSHDDRIECGHDWDDHTCIKPPGHESEPTDDDHRCCCGTSTWVTEATR